MDPTNAAVQTIDAPCEKVYTVLELTEQERNLIQRLRSFAKPGILQVYVADGAPLVLFWIPTRMEKLG